jgi:hypothetical protein
MSEEDVARERAAFQRGGQAAFAVVVRSARSSVSIFKAAGADQIAEAFEAFADELEAEAKKMFGEADPEEQVAEVDTPGDFDYIKDGEH